MLNRRAAAPLVQTQGSSIGISPTTHLNATNSKPSATVGVLIPTVETPNTGRRAALKSSWIRRLKSRDEPEHTKANSLQKDHHNPPAQGGGTLCIEKGRSLNEHVEEVRSSELAQNKASEKVSGENQAESNSKDNIFPDKWKQQKDYDADGQSKELATGRQDWPRQLTESTKFGYVNSQLAAETSSRHVLQSPRSGTSSSPLLGTQSYKKVIKRAKCKLNLNNTESTSSAAAIAPVSMGKPPVPPPRAGVCGFKIGVPPRLISQTAQGLMPGRSVPSPNRKDLLETDHDMQDFQNTGQPLESSISREGMSDSDVVGDNEDRLRAVNPERRAVGFLSNRQPSSYCEAKPRESAIMHPPWNSPHIAMQWKNDISKLPGSTGTADLSCEPAITALHLELPRAAVRELNANRSSAQEVDSLVLSESSHGTARADRSVAVPEPAPSASSTRFPWEMAAGTSRKAREDFVEVYNRARDELKNQRTSQTTSRGKDSLGVGSGQGTSGYDLPTHKAEGKVQLLHEKKAQTFMTIYGSDDRADPAPRTSQLGNPQGVSAVRSAFDALNKSHVDLCQSASVALFGYSVDFKKGNLQPNNPHLKGDLKVPQNWQCHGSKDALEQRSNTIAHVSYKGLIPESKVCTEGEGHVSNQVIKQNHTKGVGVKLQELSKSLDGKAEVYHDGCDRQHGAASLLGKRPRGVFEKAAGAETPAGAAGKGSSDNIERAPSKPHIWLQRWRHTNVGVNEIGQDCVGCSNLGITKSTECDGNRLLTEMKSGFVQNNRSIQSIEEAQGFQHIQGHSAKILPSAAAMAILGTAARQFHAAQPQRKGSFAFWSGFGMPAVRKSEAVKEKKM